MKIYLAGGGKNLGMRLWASGCTSRDYLILYILQYIGVHICWGMMTQILKHETSARAALEAILDNFLNYTF